MAKVVKLHPKIKERPDARISASALADFVIAPPDRQDVILHDARFQNAFGPPKYADALRVIRSFCSDWSHQKGTLADGLKALGKKAEASTFSPAQKEEARRCIETLELFRDAVNAFGVRSTPLLLAPKFETMEIDGCVVSVQPDLIAGQKFPPGDGQKIGMVFIRPQKRPNPDDCKKEETKLQRLQYRTELARYMLALGWMQLRSIGLPAFSIDRKAMHVWDIRMGARIDFPSDLVSREKRLRAAAGQISRLWQSIQTKPSDLV
ncbi:MAG: hypothetical protein AAF371_09290 [Pseudomonadota bacterium]